MNVLNKAIFSRCDAWECACVLAHCSLRNKCFYYLYIFFCGTRLVAAQKLLEIVILYRLMPSLLLFNSWCSLCPIKNSWFW